MIIAIAVLAALLIGFVAGLTSFKKTNEYCGRHGVTRTCPLCPPVDSGINRGTLEGSFVRVTNVDLRPNPCAVPSVPFGRAGIIQNGR